MKKSGNKEVVGKNELHVSNENSMRTFLFFLYAEFYGLQEVLLCHLLMHIKNISNIYTFKACFLILKSQLALVILQKWHVCEVVNVQPE